MKLNTELCKEPQGGTYLKIHWTEDRGVPERGHASSRRLLRYGGAAVLSEPAVPAKDPSEE